MCDGQVKKNYSARLYVLEWSALFGNRTSKNLGVLVHRTSDHCKKFLPLVMNLTRFNVSILKNHQVFPSHIFISKSRSKLDQYLSKIKVPSGTVVITHLKKY